MDTTTMMHFGLWMDEQTAKNVLAEATKHLLEIINPHTGEHYPPSSSSSWEDRAVGFEGKDDSGQMCIRGYQGFSQHAPLIHAFAQENPENFAQVILFAPLTANANFAIFNEWFPVLMHYLRRHDQITHEGLVNFISGVGSQHTAVPEMPQPQMLKSITDVGKAGEDKAKTGFIVRVWNNREKIFNKVQQMAEEGEFKDMVAFFAQMPGVQPVKAGFIVQMLYGKVGCIDTHNIKIYSQVAKMMSGNPEVDPQTREKWKEVSAKFAEAEKMKNWVADDKDNEQKMNSIVSHYVDMLDYMNKELGITPRVLWDFWVNYLAHYYDAKEKNFYSPYQGTAYGKDDAELKGIIGGKERIITQDNTPAKLFEPHPTSGAVSRVHLVSAITPDELMTQIAGNLTNRQHLINSVVRKDATIKPALDYLGNRILDSAKLNAIIELGGRVSAARKAYEKQNADLLKQLEENAQKQLMFLLTTKYKLSDREADALVYTYTRTYRSVYDKHIGQILSVLRRNATMKANKQAKQTGVYDTSRDDDAQIGFNQDRYDPTDVFDSKGVQRIQPHIDPYMKHLEPVAKTKVQIEDLKAEADAKNNLLKSLETQQNQATKRLAKLNGGEVDKNGIVDIGMIARARTGPDKNKRRQEARNLTKQLELLKTQIEPLAIEVEGLYKQLNQLKAPEGALQSAQFALASYVKARRGNQRAGYANTLHNADADYNPDLPRNV